jgi:hypothetical protein
MTEGTLEPVVAVAETVVAVAKVVAVAAGSTSFRKIHIQFFVQLTSICIRNAAVTWSGM